MADKVDLSGEMDWEKARRIKEAKERAEKDLLERELKSGKVNQGFLSAKEYGVKPHGYTNDPEVVRRNLERLAGVGICFMVPAVIFGFIIMLMGTRLGQGMGTLFDWIQAISEMVGLLCSGVAFVCSIIVIRLKKNKVYAALITSLTALLLYMAYRAIFFAVLYV